MCLTIGFKWSHRTRFAMIFSLTCLGVEAPGGKNQVVVRQRFSGRQVHCTLFGIDLARRARLDGPVLEQAVVGDEHPGGLLGEDGGADAEHDVPEAFPAGHKYHVECLVEAPRGLDPGIASADDDDLVVVGVFVLDFCSLRPRGERSGVLLRKEEGPRTYTTNVQVSR